MLEDSEVFLLGQEQVMIEVEHKQTLEKIIELQFQLDSMRKAERAAMIRKVAIRTKIGDAQHRAEQAKIEAAKKAAAVDENIWMQEIIKEMAELTEDYPAFKRLRHYQYDDIIATYAAFCQNKTGMLNANDMGAGKTVETVMSLYIFTKKYLKEHDRMPNILWLTKKSMIQSTPKEIRRWWPECKVVTPPLLANESQRNFALDMYKLVGGIFLANYEFVRTTPHTKETEWDFVVIDEVHKLKGGANANGPTVVWETCGEIAKKARFNMMLTGTPMVNAVEEMWSYLHIFAPDRFPNIKKFRQDFCEYKQIAGSFADVLTVDPAKILENALKGQMIRRSREEFGIELPELDLQIVELSMEGRQLEIYEEMRTRFFVWLDSAGENTLTATAVIAQLIRLRQIALWPASIKVNVSEEATFDDLEFNPLIPVDPDDWEAGYVEVPMDAKIVTKSLECKDAVKIDEAMDRIEMVTSIPSPVDASISEQIVIFCTFNEPMREIQRRCDKLKITCEVISGQATRREKNRDLEAEFQRGKIQVLCINSAMGEGLNLQKNPSEWIGGASYGIQLDRWWSPVREDQCIGRIHRQGAAFPVTFWMFEINPSVDLYIKAIVEEKREKFGTIMNSGIIRPKGEWKTYLTELL